MFVWMHRPTGEANRRELTMGLDDLAGKAGDALNSEKGEQISDQGLDKAGEFAEGKGLGGDKVDSAKDAIDGKIGGGDGGGDGGNSGGEGNN